LPDVSRRHCRFVFSDGRWQVFDLNSLNGIHINGEQVSHAVLHHRDTIRLGGFIFNVELYPGDRTVEVPSIAVLHQIADALPSAERRAS
jgi:pSer/pThr/pTyr-binding forkhead associated (FHA) protein